MLAEEIHEKAPERRWVESDRSKESLRRAKEITSPVRNGPQGALLSDPREVLVDTPC